MQPDAFSAQISWLVRSGHQIVSLSRLADQLQSGEPIPDHWACITFDDGYQDNYSHAFPVLKEYHVPATIFLVTGKIDRDPLFLTVAQIKEMQAFGIDFGAHTVDHVSLSSILPEQARQQVEESGRQVVALVGRPAEHFCYPFGHFNLAVEGFVKQAGFRTCCTEQAGPVHPGSESMRLRRVGILGTDSLRDFQLKVNGAYDWWINAYMQVEEWRRRRRGGLPA